jgi:hypothetical protein
MYGPGVGMEGYCDIVTFDTASLQISKLRGVFEPRQSVFESARLAIANGRLSRTEYDAWQHDYETGVSESIHCEFDDQTKQHA